MWRIESRRQRVRDPRVVRLIRQWLRAGVMHERIREETWKLICRG